ncbi:MAG: hypothetical protein JW966_10165 [Anaerolineae bacterium]|nr:hypothetical protein [Anaerolineae bacterium]
MTDNLQPNTPDDIDLVQRYRQTVLEYEALDEEIDGLLSRHDGATEHMSAEDHDHYRRLAYKRDTIYNQMKALERQIALDDESDETR